VRAFLSQRSCARAVRDNAPFTWYDARDAPSGSPGDPIVMRR
jgi:hypothetical protein